MKNPDEPQASSSIISLSSSNSNHSNYGGIEFFSQNSTRNSTPQNALVTGLEEEVIAVERVSLIPEVDFEGIHLDMGDHREYQPLLGNGSGCMNPRGCDNDEHTFNNFPGMLLSLLF